jgi:hypothetical protein
VFLSGKGFGFLRLVSHFLMLIFWFSFVEVGMFEGKGSRVGKRNVVKNL